MQIIKNVLSKEQCVELMNLELDYFHLYRNGGYDNPDKELNLNNNVYYGACRVNRLPRPKIYDYILNLFEGSTIVSCFILRYEKDSFLDLHVDVPPTSDVEGVTKVSVILLNDNFTGGELVFPNVGKSFDTSCVGDLVQIETTSQDPLYIHKVNKITSGTRYSLVIKTVS
jgi:hypothetical protein